MNTNNLNTNKFNIDNMVKYPRISKKSKYKIGDIVYGKKKGSPANGMRGKIVDIYSTIKSRTGTYSGQSYILKDTKGNKLSFQSISKKK